MRLVVHREACLPGLIRQVILSLDIFEQARLVDRPIPVPLSPRKQVFRLLSRAPGMPALLVQTLPPTDTNPGIGHETGLPDLALTATLGAREFTC